jgi:hypothetical protein
MADRLDNAKDYYDLVLEPNFSDYSTKSYSFQSLINCLGSLFHMHEWVFAHDNAKASALWGIPLNSTWDVWNHVETSVPLAKYIRDNANSAKHVELNRKPSTNALFFANTSITTGGFDSGSFDRTGYDTGGIHVDENNTTVDLDQAIKDTYAFWKSYYSAAYP